MLDQRNLCQNPNRKDSIELLERAVAQGAVLVRWMPSIMDIDPSDEFFIPFYKKMAELGIPLLSHTGMARSFAHARDELSDPFKLLLPLKHGVTVIAAHMAATGRSEGQDNFERLLSILPAYPNFYTDISSLTQIKRQEVAFPERINRKWLIVYRFQLQPNILKRLLTQTVSTWITKAGFVVNTNFFTVKLKIFENHQSAVRQPPHRLWHRHKVSLGLNTSSALSRRNGSVL
jgi:hypothetical protein